MRHLRESDVSRTGEILASAFQDDPFYRLLFPDPGVRAGVLPAYFEASSRVAGRVGCAYVVTGPATVLGLGSPGGAPGRVLGAALWERPQSPQALRDDRPPHDVADHRDLFGASAFENYVAVMRHLAAIRSKDPGGRHWYLNLIGVVRGAQQRGIGDALLRPILARADADGVPCYLETFADATLPWYARLGFAMARTGVEPRTGLSWWTMIRPARPR